MLYIVRYFDLDVEEATEYEYSNLDHAMETYNTLNGQSGVSDLVILTYNFDTKEYNNVTPIGIITTNIKGGISYVYTFTHKTISI